jgi:hypothetical protein
VVNLVARHANESVVAPMMGSGCLRVAAVWSQSVDPVLVCLAGIAMKIFLNLIYFIRNFMNVVLSVRFAKIILQ